ncbi:MAG: LLM class F420-dependent oxidoreductase [Pseudonocardia sp.]|uniref:LLM class F420-dependent oxidoreductase n=1 Tax=unclassified Pseudonocardia TaxID=2619320 RepID=UPI00086C7058|nr:MULTISPECIES: LLM class F420-dependent oxidoreductase [unclassified Pseudonocardia]MBN9111651.1 LLM class F420-dependent oxidoreductase [Pseudonocardia sp.]ODU26445.1 MAG: LLM class F420-dependent oxidoreductase [Pseudonocardia sp. SCN 72-51]ODV02248.1 MAG: LLM class F420-dependent oxidoreductase [Pseudonocardia sp. SCN 73-27]
MRIGLHLSDLTYPDGPTTLADDLTRIVVAAEDAGFARVSVMDHVWQIAVHGSPEHDMLEAYTTLGFIAARTSRVELLSWVTAVSYRAPGLLAKLVSTLDVLSGGRAWLGVGAAWNAEEAVGLGLDFPPLAQRFEMLEETVQICRQMWDPENDGPYDGTHYHLGRTLNVPAPLHRPKILIGGGGEKKTLRLVAKFADACNVINGPELEHKLAVLRGHCETEGRDYGEIEKTAQVTLELGEGKAGVDEFLETLRGLAALGVDSIQGKLPGVWETERIERFGREIVPAAAEL